MQPSAFSIHPLNQALLKTLDDLGYSQMTPIQAQSLGPILEGKDVIAQGKTGSGKTAAFSLGLLNKLRVKRFRIQSLVLCPTRELADQVAKEIRRLARGIHNIKVLTLCGGMPIGPQIGSLEHGAHIIVGTPGRIEDLIRKEKLNLEEVDTLVLDEADRMLEMGFQESLDAIFAQCPDDRQSLLFSATFPEAIKKIANDLMDRPVSVKVTATHDGSSIKQSFYQLKDSDDRNEALNTILLKHQPESAVVFCHMKQDVDDVADFLTDAGFSCLALHGDYEQKQRNQTLVRFANKSATVLVATDVAARGLDIDNLDMVINYHISRDPEIHVHRIGRTGRAGSKGLACSLFVEKEFNKIGRIESYLDTTIEPVKLPQLTGSEVPPQAAMATLQIDGGKKQKVRAGDILGALTGNEGIEGSQVGKIDIFDGTAYVAVTTKSANKALKKISNGKLKGRNFKVRRVRG